jgi:hypothetical protein
LVFAAGGFSSIVVQTGWSCTHFDDRRRRQRRHVAERARGAGTVRGRCLCLGVFHKVCFQASDSCRRRAAWRVRRYRRRMLTCVCCWRGSRSLDPGGGGLRQSCGWVLCCRSRGPLGSYHPWWACGNRYREARPIVCVWLPIPCSVVRQAVSTVGGVVGWWGWLCRCGVESCFHRHVRFCGGVVCADISFVAGLTCWREHLSFIGRSGQRAPHSMTADVPVVLREPSGWWC